MKKITIFVVLTICFVFSTKYINATGFSDTFSLRSKLLATNEGGFNFIIMETYKNLDLQDLPNEIWKDIKGYESKYQISNVGRIKGIRRKVNTAKNSYRIVKEKIKAQRMKPNGYLTINLCKNSIKKSYEPHNLVAKHFVENPNNKPEINHEDGVKTHNKANNLKWVTRLENVRHAIETGLFQYKKVIQKTLNGEFIKTWKSVSIISTELNYNLSSIYNCCNKRSETSHGFIWEYK